MRRLPFSGASRVLCVAFLLACSSAFNAAAQSAPPSDARAKTPQTAAQKQPPPPIAKQKSGSSKLSKLAAERKVITTEDLEKPHAQKTYQLEKTREAPSADPAECDAECAAEAREVAGFGPARLGEWDIQFVAAKHYLANDAQWRRAYFEALQKSRMYCTFQKQQETAVPPTGGDYRSRMERAQQEQYVSDMDHTLSTSLQGLSAQMSRLIDSAQTTEPVRAAIMTVLAGRIFSQCAGLDDP